MSWRGTPDEAVVYDAVGLVSAQANCDEDEGLRLLTGRAVEVTRTVADTARLVIAGVIRFDGRTEHASDGHPPRLAQAQSIVAAQTDCTMDEALLLMQGRARSSDLSLAYIANAVLEGGIRFDE